MKNLLLAGTVLLSTFAQSQLVNNGATITVQPGATIFCSGSFTNTSGTVTNDGKIEVQGNFANSGTYNSTTNQDLLVMSGAGNATLNSGGAILQFLTINKASNADRVTLASTVVVGTQLDYQSGVLTTDYLANPSYLLSAPTSAVFNFAAGREVVGSVKRTGWANGSTVVFNAPHMQLVTANGTAPTELTVTMLPGAFSGDPSQVEREVKRKFLFTQTGGSGFSTDIRFPYMASELNSNVEGNLVPWSLIPALPTAEWTARLTGGGRDVTNDWVNTTAVDVTALAQEWKLADPRYTFNVTAYLRGPFGGGAMSTALNTGGLIPAGQPYGPMPFDYPGTENASPAPANAVDWVLVEFRKPSGLQPADATSLTRIGRKAGFLRNDGTMINADGAPFSFDIEKQGGGFIAVRHRNHLGVLSTLVPSNEDGTIANNFSVLANVYKNPIASSDPVTLLPSSALYGLWSGDANTSNSVNSLDVNAVKSATSVLLTGYVFQDITLSGAVNSLDLNQTKATISTLGQSSMSRTAGTRKSSLPD